MTDVIIGLIALVGLFSATFLVINYSSSVRKQMIEEMKEEENGQEEEEGRDTKK